MTAAAAVTASPAGRIEALDAVRGIAAFLVLLSHLYVTLPDATQAVLRLDDTPLSLFVLGRPAVILFFVLSGFVLSLSLLAPRAPGYGAFVVRRICRIYLPFAVAILAAAMAKAAIEPGPVPVLSDWFNRNWTGTVDLPHVMAHLAMLGSGPQMSLNNPMWSLVVEMRISLLFPLLLALVGLRLPMTVAALLLTSLATILIGLSPWLPKQPYSGETLLQALLFTAYFVSFFVLGILLAIERRRVVALVQRLGPRLRLGLWLAAIAGLGVYQDIVNGIAAGLIIALTLGSTDAQAWLSRPVLQWLGRISYSLYLTHVVVLLVLLHLLHGVVPTVWLLLALIPLSLAVAHLTYHLVERPAIRLGHRLTRPRAPVPVGAGG